MSDFTESNTIDRTVLDAVASRVGTGPHVLREGTLGCGKYLDG